MTLNPFKIKFKEKKRLLVRGAWWFKRGGTMLHPHSSLRQRERYTRQIASGMLKINAQGLAH